MPLRARGARPVLVAIGAGENRRQSLLRHPIHLGACRGGAHRLRSPQRRGGKLGPGAPFQAKGFTDKRGRSHGRQIEAAGRFATVHALEIACLSGGNSAEIATLGMLEGELGKNSVDSHMREAARAGLVACAGIPAMRFLHDRVQEAAYSLIERRPSASPITCASARCLAAAIESSETASRNKVFDVVNPIQSRNRPSSPTPMRSIWWRISIGARGKQGQGLDLAYPRRMPLFRRRGPGCWDHRAGAPRLRPGLRPGASDSPIVRNLSSRFRSSRRVGLPSSLQRSGFDHRQGGRVRIG